MEGNIWDSQHEKYAQTDWIDKPSLFAEFSVTYFPKEGKILELGCGQGQDTRFFAEHGYSLVALDSSQKGIEYAQEKTPEVLKSTIEYHVADIAKPLDFGDDTFDVVYSHLAIHYFSTEETERLFAEIYRVLTPGGILAFFVNSTSDVEHGQGNRIEENYFEIRDIKKRFFSLEDTKNFTKAFAPLVLDDNGETYKDRAIGTANLIRYIGRK